MVHINITAEGQTEELFVKQLLAPHLLTLGKLVRVRCLRTSDTWRGGYSTFVKVKNDVEQWLKQEPGAWHTTLLDLYGLNNKFPGYEASKHFEAYSKVAYIEKAFYENIDFWRFIPFVQLHKFESLLFANPQLMEEWMGLDSQLRPNVFTNILASFNNEAELINDSRETAPSKRILAACPAYRKTRDGLMILEDIGLSAIRAACPHFNSWVTKLEGLT